MKRRVLFLSCVALFVLALAPAYALEESETAVREETDLEEASLDDAAETTLNEAEAEFADAELEQGEGITPDSGLYFVEDKILSQFRDDVENREKKIAEVRAMVREGNIEAARKALERYKEYADNLEQEADPSKREEARRSAVAIRNALEEMQDKIPEEQREAFVDEVIAQEASIVTAVEIANKIKGLCTELAKLDPLQYEQTCKTGDDGPRWQRELYNELTGEQKEEAQNFVRVMSQCLRTQGETCNCKEISITAFADKCSEVAPLYAECSKTGKEELCKQADELSEGMEELLPDYLQEVMLQLEGELDNAQYENHIPGPCQEAGITGENRDDRQRCFKIMVQQNAPEECREALAKAEIDNPRDAREMCEKIMFEQNAPEECVAAGLTGESPGDGRKCEKIMGELRGQEGREGPNRGPSNGFGPDCRRIQDSEERLKCYDGALEQAQGFRDEFREGEFREREFRDDFREMPEECKKNPDACRGRFEDRRGPPPECEGLNPEECGQRMRERFENRPPEEFREGEFREREFRDERREEFGRRPDDFNREFGERTAPPEGAGPERSGGESVALNPESSSPASGAPESSSDSGSQSGGGESTTTGSVISGRVVFGDSADNGFLRYFYRFFK